ncbi:hypothetical protein KAH94_03540 [bacterium]|nr:hypothetical protein [bacterium]
MKKKLILTTIISLFALGSLQMNAMDELSLKWKKEYKGYYYPILTSWYIYKIQKIMSTNHPKLGVCKEIIPLFNTNFDIGNRLKRIESFSYKEKKKWQKERYIDTYNNHFASRKMAPIKGKTKCAISLRKLKKELDKEVTELIKKKTDKKLTPKEIAEVDQFQKKQAKSLVPIYTEKIQKLTGFKGEQNLQKLKKILINFKKEAKEKLKKENAELKKRHKLFLGLVSGYSEEKE